MEFQEFDSIEVLESMVTITEKIHGTNAQIAIDDFSKEIFAGSRTRWVTPEDDNAGFARWVFDNKENLIRVLGPGRHYGEWMGAGIGAGIGAGYGLKEKRFVLFNTFRWTSAKAAGLLLPRMDVVPILYQGVYTPTCVKETMDKLLAGGSVLVPGYPNPEGVVMFFSRTKTLFKQVFDKETVAWANKEKKERPPADAVFEEKVGAYLHPKRLEKLMMRDERYLRDYPKTLPEIARDYVADLVKESEPIDAEVLKGLKKKVFPFIQAHYGK